MDRLLVPLAKRNENTPGTAETRLPIIIQAEIIRVCPSRRPAIAKTSGNIIADMAKKSANLFLISNNPRFREFPFKFFTRSIVTHKYKKTTQMRGLILCANKSEFIN